MFRRSQAGHGSEGIAGGLNFPVGITPVNIGRMSNMLTSNFLADVGVGHMGDAAMAEGVKPNVEKHPSRSLMGSFLKTTLIVLSSLRKVRESPNARRTFYREG